MCTKGDLDHHREQAVGQGTRIPSFPVLLDYRHLYSCKSMFNKNLCVHQLGLCHRANIIFKHNLEPLTRGDESQGTRSLSYYAYEGTGLLRQGGSFSIHVVLNQGGVGVEASGSCSTMLSFALHSVPVTINKQSCMDRVRALAWALSAGGI